MDGGVDLSNRKPRRTFGTPSYKYRNRFAFAVIVVGTAIFAAFNALPLSQHANERLREDFMTASEEELERKQLFSFIPQKRGEDILKIMQHKEDLEKER